MSCSRGLISKGSAIGSYINSSNGALTGLGHNLGFLLVELGIKNLMINLAHGKHFGEQLTDFHRGGTYQTGSPADAHLLYFLNNGTIFLAVSLVDTVVEVMACDGAVGRNLYHVELVDVPELSSLGAGRTGHTSQLVVHSEIVLQGNGGEGLCGSLYSHMLLGLYSLVQAVAPTTTFHDTSGLLVNNLHLSVHHHILIVLIKHGVGLEQLLQGVYAVALNSIVIEEIVLLIQSFLVGEFGLCLQFRQLRSNVGEHEEVMVVHLLSQPFCAFIGEVGTVELLVHNEEQWFNSLRHQSVVILHVDFLSLLESRLDPLLREIFDQSLILGQSFIGTEQAQEAFIGEILVLILSSLIDFLACFGQQFGGLFALNLI